MVSYGADDKAHLIEHGWVVLDAGLDAKSLIRFTKSLERMRARALSESYPIGRIYWDYFGADNIAAIEAPFNAAIVEPEVFELFQHLDLGRLIPEFMNWPEACCTLARLFCMERFNYRGNWHRDYSEYQPNVSDLTSLQVAVYVEDQPGFRILKKNMEFDRDGSIFSDRSAADAILNFARPVDLPREAYIEVEGRAGTIMLFNPSVMHQGSSSKRRLDFHMRFRSLEVVGTDATKLEDPQLGFRLLDYLGPNFEVDRIRAEKLLPLIERASLPRRLVNSVGYYTGLRNALDYFRYRGAYRESQALAPLCVDLRANTTFQD